MVVGSAQRVIGFLKKTFDATELRRYDLPDGSIMHVEVRIGDSVIMMGDGGEKWPPFPSSLHVYADDVDATYARVSQAGGTAVQEPQRKGGDPGRRGGAKDPCGNTWWIAAQMD
ncbi:MAG: VOC family protein [Bryobacterales bacterium]|nr:VOC family protein [Bryobacterales bacterium]MEB2360889.1 VOC family protein [Bryobacterales bacterium]